MTARAIVAALPVVLALAAPGADAADVPLMTIQSPTGAETWSLPLQVLVLMT